MTWKNEANFFFYDSEFFNEYQTGQTVPGLQHRTYFQFEATPSLKLNVGAFVQNNIGFTNLDLKPILSIEVGNEKFHGLFGSLNRSERIRMIEPLYDPRLSMFRPMEYGFQLVSKGELLQWDLFFNYQKAAAPGEKEIMDAGISGKMNLGKGFAVEAQGHGVHKGGQAGGEGAAYSNFAFAGGPSGDHQLSDSVQMQWRAFAVGAMDQFYLSSRSDGAIGKGAYVALDFTFFNSWMLGGRAFYGSNFYAKDGSSLYSSLNESGGSYRNFIEYQNIRAGKRFSLTPDLTADLFLYLHRVEKVIEPSVDLNLKFYWDTVLLKQSK